MAINKKKSTLGQILKHDGFIALLDKAKDLDDAEFFNLTSTCANNPKTEKTVSDLDELLFYVPDFFYVKNDKGESTNLPAPGVFEFIEWAIENGAHPNRGLKHGVSCFLKSASLPDEQLIKYFIENIKDLDMHQQDGRGFNAIMYSVQNRRENNFDYLEKLGEYDINKKYFFVNDRTLLHTACALGHESLIDKLCSLGCDLTHKDTKGFLPKDFIPTKTQNDLYDDDITPELLEHWDQLALKLEDLTDKAIIKKASSKKTYKVSF